MPQTSNHSANLLHCFGVGHGWPTRRRHHSSYLYQLDGQILLIDCGEPLSTTFKASNRSYNSLDRILISHFHGDHIGGFLMFFQSLWLEKRTRDLYLHLPADGIEPLQKMLQLACLFDELFSFKLHFVPLEEGQVIESGPIRILPFLTSHLDSLRASYQHKYPLKFEAFCFRFETPSLSVGHSADLGSPDDLVCLVDQPLDLLVCELAHFDPQALYHFLRGRPIRQLQLVHLNESQWVNRQEILDQARSELPGMKIEIPEDGTTIAL